MKYSLSTLFVTLALSFNAQAALNDQGLNSIISIIDTAISALPTAQVGDKTSSESTKTNEEIATDLSNSTIVNMARTLGKLSFSRLQCGEASVLGEFTKRVQAVPKAYQNLMRNAFQDGFDKSRTTSKLLSDDECKRLTESRQLKAEVAEDKIKAPTKETVKEEQPKAVEDPSLQHMRLAHMTGQFAYKRKYCGDKNIVTQDYNSIIAGMPKDIQKKGREAYWKGFQQGKRMNKYLTLDNC